MLDIHNKPRTPPPPPHEPRDRNTGKGADEALAKLKEQQKRNDKRNPKDPRSS